MMECQPSQDICSLCHVFLKWHKCNLSNYELVLPESERKEEDTNNTANKESGMGDSNGNKLRRTRVVDSEDIPLAASAEGDD